MGQNSKPWHIFRKTEASRSTPLCVAIFITHFGAKFAEARDQHCGVCKSARLRSKKMPKQRARKADWGEEETANLVDAYTQRKAIIDANFSNSTRARKEMAWMEIAAHVNR
jgi:hypothetical protein